MLGIIVLNYNTWEDTIECVQSILKTTKINYKIYIVDNKSSDSSFEILSEKYKSNSLIYIIKSEINGGYSAGNNLGIRRALEEGADAVLLSNSDIIYYENSIDTMYNKYQTNKKDVGLIGPKVLLLNGDIQHLIRKNYTFVNYLFSKKPLNKIDIFDINKKTYHRDYKYDRDYSFYGFLSGCCLLISDNYFKLAGLLDENIFLYYEESIIGLNAKKVNLKSYLVINANVLHKSSASIGNKNSAFSRFHRYYSSMYMMRRYVKVKLIPFTLIFLINYLPFLFNSLRNNEYRKMIKNFTVKSIKLYFKNYQ
jgi:GT2 family glycosyltransferase